MRESLEDRRIAATRVATLIFGGVMAVLYLVGGTVIIFQGSSLGMMGKYTTPLGVVLLLYGAFRAYTVYQKYSSSRRY